MGFLTFNKALRIFLNITVLYILQKTNKKLQWWEYRRSSRCVYSAGHDSQLQPIWIQHFWWQNNNKTRLLQLTCDMHQLPPDSLHQGQ